MMDQADTKPTANLMLSTEQQRSVDFRGGHLQVIACARSGKIESISRRVAALIGEGAAPESIIAFTFTEKAATEIKDWIYKRFADIKGSKFLGDLGRCLSEQSTRSVFISSLDKPKRNICGNQVMSLSFDAVIHEGSLA